MMIHMVLSIKLVLFINGLCMVANMYINAQLVALATVFAMWISAVVIVCGMVWIVLCENAHLGAHILIRSITTIMTMVSKDGAFMHMQYVRVVDIVIIKTVHVNVLKVIQVVFVKGRLVHSINVMGMVNVFIHLVVVLALVANVTLHFMVPIAFYNVVHGETIRKHTS
jgi:hypothetical protein